MIHATSPRGGLPFFALVSFACALPAQVTVVVPCAADNTLYQSATGALSNGSGASIFAGTTGTNSIRRALVRFDVAALVPANATILHAELGFNVAQTSVALPMPMTVHRVQQSWGEGTSNATSGNGGGGTASTANDATWLHTYFPGSTWNNAGGDFDATPSFAMSVPTSGPVSSGPQPAVAAQVQAWLTSPATNHGWVLRMDESIPGTAHRIDSSEVAAPGVPPTLTVTYMLQGTNGSWGTGCPVGAGNFTTTFVGAPIGGSTIQIAKSQATPSSIGVDFFSFALDPIGVPLLPGCTIHLTAPLVSGGTFLTDGIGNGSTSFGIPPGLAGLLLTCQAAVLDFNPLGFVVSNAALTVLQ